MPATRSRPVRPPVPALRAGALAAALMMGWLTVVLWCDRADGGGSPVQQRALGVLTWAVLLVALTRLPSVVRLQAGVVVAFATVVEYLASPTFHVYTYRFDNVPAYVPPGHGLVYLSAYALGHSPVVRRHPGAFAAVVLTLLGAWAVYGAVLAPRPDLLGLMWFGCLAAFVRWGPSTPVYVGAAAVVTWLELAGTHLGTWTWSTRDPTGTIPIGNPPTGAAGGYGWFDLVALLVARTVTERLSRGRPRVAGRVGRESEPRPDDPVDAH